MRNYEKKNPGTKTNGIISCENAYTPFLAVRMMKKYNKLNYKRSICSKDWNHETNTPNKGKSLEKKSHFFSQSRSLLFSFLFPETGLRIFFFLDRNHEQKRLAGIIKLALATIGHFNKQKPVVDHLAQFFCSRWHRWRDSDYNSKNGQKWKFWIPAKFLKWIGGAGKIQICYFRLFLRLSQNNKKKT